MVNENDRQTGPRKRPVGKRRRIVALLVVLAALTITALYFTDQLPAFRNQGTWDGVLSLVLGIGIAILAVFTALAKGIQWVVVRGIERRMDSVPGKPARKAAAPDAGPTATTAEDPPPEQAAHPANPPGLAIEVVLPTKLPPRSTETLHRLEAIMERGPKVRRMYQIGISFLAVVTIIVAFGMPAIGPLAWRGMPEVTLLVLFGVLTGVYLFGMPNLLQNVSIPAISIITGILYIVLFGWVFRLLDRREWNGEVMKPRQWLPALVGGAWVLAAGWVVAAILADGNGTAAALLGLAIAVYLLWIWFSMLRLDHLYPIHPPLYLLSLRVFDSPSLDRFLDLIDRWPWIGVTQYLHGPGTTAKSLGDKMRFFLGRGDDLVIENEQELDAAFRTFSTRTNRQLQYPRHAIQCTNATWKQGLYRMLARAHVVVMDLSTFSEKNRGCAFEIGRLINTLPTDRFLLLIDDATDMDVLHHVIAQQWRAMAPDSPNRDAAHGPLKLLHMGGPWGLRQDESVRAWWRRLPEHLDDERLVGVLCDIALRAAPADPAAARRWSHFPPAPPIPLLKRLLMRPRRRTRRERAAAAQVAA